MINTEKWQTLVININIATMAGQQTELAIIEQGALAISAGKIVWLGKQEQLPVYQSNKITVINGNNQWLTPGLIDCHSHLIYAGSRVKEFEMRLQGASYQDIAQAGGGIYATVTATRAASTEQLLAMALTRANALQRQGVTTLEIKSGYGLDKETEIKMLKVAQLIAQQLPISIQATYLGAHAFPKETSADDYLKLICTEIIPQLAKEQLVQAVDVFCEKIAFNVGQAERVYQAATEHGLAIKMHAEQLSNLGGSILAAKYEALSVDHLEYLDEAGVKAIKKANVVAVLLPGAYYFLREKQLPPITLLRQYQVPIAIATDLNPGSSPLCDIQLMMHMAGTLFQLTPNEVLHAVTSHAAQALGLASSKGKIALGYDADFAIWNISQPAELCYQFGLNPLTQLFQAGQRVV